MEKKMGKEHAKYFGTKEQEFFSDRKMKQMRKSLKSLNGAKYDKSKKDYTVNDTKQFFEYYRLATHSINEVAEEAQEFRDHLGNIYSVKAEKLADAYHKTGFLRIRRGFSGGEIRTHLIKKDKMIKFLDGVKAVNDAANKAIKVFNKAETAWNTFEALYNINNHYQITRSNETMKTNARALREDFHNAYLAMNEVMKLVDTVSKVAPPGVQEYIGFITQSFNAAGKGIVRVKDYAETIDKATSSTKKLRESLDRKKAASESLKFDDKHNISNLTLDQELDFKLGRPR